MCLQHETGRTPLPSCYHSHTLSDQHWPGRSSTTLAVCCLPPVAARYCLNFCHSHIGNIPTRYQCHPVRISSLLFLVGQMSWLLTTSGLVNSTPNVSLTRDDGFGAMLCLSTQQLHSQLCADIPTTSVRLNSTALYLLYLDEDNWK